MEDLKLLKAQRAQIKRAVTRHRRFLDGLKEEERSTFELKERKDKLARTWEDFNLVQLKIETLEEGNEDNDLQREEFENNYFELMAGMQEVLERVETRVNSNQNLAVVLPREEKVDRVRLPPIEIGHFSGKYEEWVPFVQLFKSMVHENIELGDLQKFHYLRSALTGPAADVISALELTPENYLEAWTLLLERYDNRRLIIQNHIKAIFDSQNVSRDNSSSLRNFVDNFKRHFRALRALKSDAVESSDLLIYFVLSKMDLATVREWENQQSREGKPTIQDLLDFLTHKCETLEVLKRSSGTSQQISHFRKVQSANASTVGASLRCPICKQGHVITKCESFKTLSANEKFRKILDKGLCINCLKSGSHLAKNCFAAGCKHCNEKHHVLLHEHFYPAEAETVVTSANCVADLHNTNQIVLSTIKIEVFDSDGHKHYCRALLDCGSQCDFISERLVKKLKLKRESLNISVVGIGQKPTQTFERTNIKIKSRINKYCINIKPLVLKRITDDLPIQTFDKSLIKIPRHVVLADPEFNVSGEIDLLIGSQNFWNCINNKSIQLRGQPRLHETKFGWIVAGGWRNGADQINRRVSNLAAIESADLTKFWETENVSNYNEMTIEEKYCAEHFERTYKREYENLGHMAEVKEDSDLQLECQNYFIPHNYQSLLRNHQHIRIPRPVCFGGMDKIEFYGISDASEGAYGACICVKSNLLCSRSRVSPIKTISLPKLELCASVLLTKLIQRIKISLNVTSEKIFCWTDSKILLAWIGSNSKKWSVSVAHRVGMIQENILIENWLHVPSEEDPAESISRECGKRAVESLQLWWRGPAWLYSKEKAWPKGISQLNYDEVPEMKRIVNKVIEKRTFEVFNKYRTYKRMVRVVAYLQSFIENCKHKTLLHTGAQTTLATVRERFWPVFVKSLKSLVHNCIKCRSGAPIAAQYVMGSLPKDRTKYFKPFKASGVDYCEPFLIKEGKLRNSRTCKIWAAVFVCLSVKAVHLEIATDLTAEGFLNSLQRFIARRGIVQKLFSDNATNFAATSQELHSIEWSFIPPRVPHFGGLWEAVVKAFKTHLKRAVGEQVLTYGEFNTLSISIEAILNSRPLIPLSDDVNDYSALTPAHFLIGDPLVAILTNNESFKCIKLSKRWQLVQYLKQWFWKRWYTEYLRACQMRAKWPSGGAPVVLGQLVMTLEDAPIGKMILGRVIEVFKGGDGIVRVLKVRTTSGEFKRPVRKIAPLPIPIPESGSSEDADVEKS